MNSTNEQNNEVARLHQQIRNMQEIIDDDTKQKTELHNEVARLREELETIKGEATREIMLRDKIEKRCEIAEAENQKLRELLERSLKISPLTYPDSCEQKVIRAEYEALNSTN
jgi:predicted RNase H-like nuclease (RuvC/YqgF family)